MYLVVLHDDTKHYGHCSDPSRDWYVTATNAGVLDRAANVGGWTICNRNRCGVCVRNVPCLAVVAASTAGPLLKERGSMSVIKT